MNIKRVLDINIIISASNGLSNTALPPCVPLFVVLSCGPSGTELVITITVNIETAVFISSN